MARKVNRATLEHIKASEGVRLKAYPDPGSRNGDPWTIGYGSTRGVKKGDVITAEEAERRLAVDLGDAEAAVEKAVKVPLNDNQFGALVSFVFNVGAGAFRESTLLRLLNTGQYDAVPAQLARWNKNDGAVMAGLTKRRAAEAKLWNTPAGTTSAPKPAPLPIDLPDDVAPEPAFNGGPTWQGWALLAVGAVIAYLVFQFVL